LINEPLNQSSGLHIGQLDQIAKRQANYSILKTIP